MQLHYLNKTENKLTQIFHTREDNNERNIIKNIIQTVEHKNNSEKTTNEHFYVDSNSYTAQLNVE